MSVVDDDPVAATTAPVRAPVARPRPHVLRRLLRNTGALTGAVVLIVIVLSAVLAPWLAPHDPEQQSIETSFLPPFWADGGDMAYPLGSDRLGRDILSRVIYGARISLLIGVTAVAIALVIGVVLGVLAGYLGGWVESVTMRISDMQLAIPYILLAIVLAAAIGPSVLTVILVLGGTRWVVYARITRGEVLALRARDFVRAAVSVGATHTRIVRRHILPNLLSSILVIATIEFSIVILAESSLSFLGMGIPVATPSWGSMLADGRDYLSTGWWLSVFPGVALMLTVLSISLIGNWLRDTFDPGLRTDV